MRKLFGFLYFIFIISFASKAQDSTSINKNTVYVEAFGIGMRYSVNYERYFDFKKTDLGISLSGGVAPNFSEPKYLWFPLRLNANYDIGKSRVGAGIDYMFGYYWIHSFIHPEDVIRGTNGWLLYHINYSYEVADLLSLKISLLFIDISTNNYSYLANLPFLNLELYNNQFVIWPGLLFGYSF